MATDALRAQVATKWQESFNRLNKSEDGISGLMAFSQVCLAQVIGCVMADFKSNPGLGNSV